MVTARKKKKSRIRQRGPAPVRIRERPRVAGKKFKPVLKEPEKTQFIDAVSLEQAAYVESVAIGFPLTIYQVVGACRRLGYYNYDARNTVQLRGVLIRRQQTLILKVALPKLEELLRELYT